MPTSFGCVVNREMLVSTPISPMGDGWSARCDVGELHKNGNLLPTFGGGGNKTETAGKLLPAGNPNMPGTSVNSSSLTGFVGLSNLELSPLHKDLTIGRQKIGSTSSRSGTLLGIGNFSTPDVITHKDINWNTFSIRQEKEWGFAFSAFDPNFFITLTSGLSLTSILNLNKPENAPTLRDNARLMSLNIGIGFGYRVSHDLDNKEDSANFQPWALFNYVYSDLMALGSVGINYKSIDRDIVTTKTFTGKDVGLEDNSQEPSATSDTPTLLSIAHFFGAMTAGEVRKQFKRISADSQDGLLYYHLGRTALVGAFHFPGAVARPDVLAPTTFSSARTLADLFALRHSKSPQEAMVYHLLIGGGMLLLGAAANSSPYGKALAQAGMEGFTATALTPDPFYYSRRDEAKKWGDATWVEYQPLSSYHRSGGKYDANGSRPAVRIETTFTDSPLYLAAELGTPMADASSVLGRATAFLRGKEGSVEYANSKDQIPADVASTIGLRATSYKSGDHVSITGNIGAGPDFEWSDSGMEPGARAEAGVVVAVHPSSTWSFGFSGRCSATKFIEGYSTSCNAGINFQL